MSKMDVNELLKLLSTMDKDQLQKGLSQASQILNSPKADDIINQIKNKQDNKND